MNRAALLLATGVAGVIVIGLGVEPRLWPGQRSGIQAWRTAGIAVSILCYSGGCLLADDPPLGGLH